MVRVVMALLPSLAALVLAQSPASASASGAPGVTADELTVVPGPGVTLSVDGRPYAGQIVLAPDRGGVDVVDRVGFEEYVEGIGEMPSNWPAAALQAQAVAARTYALWTVLTHPSSPGGGQICATDSCQVYIGLAKPQGRSGANWVAAVRATQGQVLQYQGRIIEALYGSSDGGQTLSGGVPWLPAVADPQDDLAPEHQWTWSQPLDAMAGVLGVPAGTSLVSLVSSSSAITETLRNPDKSTSTVALTPEQFHSVLNTQMPAPPGLDLPLPSYRYSVSTYGTTVKIAGWGDGNGLGLSQYGALGKALQGWSGGQILGNYYQGATVAPLPPGEMPATIGVTLESGVTAAGVAATGPVRVVDRTGRTLASTSGPGGWRAAPARSGVALTPAAGVRVDPAAVAAAADTAPIPPRVTTPQAAQSAAPAASSSTTLPASPSASGTPVAGTAARVPAAAVDPASSASTRRPGRGALLIGALVLGVVAAGLGGTAIFRVRTRPKSRDCPARR
ncbi:MAG TPA: SpoIID/LytB domain-containing protein [Acidimicrobiales bacterium]|nr:SpoIID/LytB domain-containing protein [Acidimicrobiales bacterium]